MTLPGSASTPPPSATPLGPTAPAVPAVPAAPRAPTGPAGPIGPCGPAGPSAPRAPRLPDLIVSRRSPAAPRVCEHCVFLLTTRTAPVALSTQKYTVLAPALAGQAAAAPSRQHKAVRRHQAASGKSGIEHPLCAIRKNGGA